MSIRLRLPEASPPSPRPQRRVRRSILLQLVWFASVVFLLVALGRAAITNPLACAPQCVNSVLTFRDLVGYDLSGTSFVESNLRGSNLSNADLSNADLSGANLTDVNLSNADLSGARLVGANLEGADLRDVRMRDTDLRGANLFRADLTRTSLNQAVLSGVILDEAILIETQLAGADLAGVNLRNADLTGANLDETTFDGAIVSGADLSNVSLRDASMVGAFLNLTTLTGADLAGANLAGAALIGAELASSALQGANLGGAQLTGANLSGANVSDASLRGARLFRDEIEQRILANDPIFADFEEARLSALQVDANLSGIIFNEATIWPLDRAEQLGATLGTDFAVEQASGTDEPGVEVIPERFAVVESNTGDELDLTSFDGAITLLATTSASELAAVFTEQFQFLGYPSAITVENVEKPSAFAQLCPADPDVRPRDLVLTMQPITDAERAACLANNHDPVSFQLGTTSLVLVVSRENTFLEELSVADLARVFSSQRWIDVQKRWPDSLIRRYAPARDTDALQFFSNRVGVPLVPESQQPSEQEPTTTFLNEERAIVQRITGDPLAVGIVSLESYENNRTALRAITLEGVPLSRETVRRGQYPLSETVLLYSTAATLQQSSGVAAFVGFALNSTPEIAADMGILPSSATALGGSLDRLFKASTLLGARETLLGDHSVNSGVVFTVPDPLIPVPPGASQTNLLPSQISALQGTLQLTGAAALRDPLRVMAAGFVDKGFPWAVNMQTLSNETSFAQLCNAGISDVALVTRPISEVELRQCRARGREPVELVVGSDVVAVVVNEENDVLQDVPLLDLASVFTVGQWRDLNGAYPARAIQRVIAPPDSLAFEHFSGAVAGTDPDTLLEAPSVVVATDATAQSRAIAANVDSIGFMPYPSFVAHEAALAVVAVDGVLPTADTIADQTYPLTRPVLLYTTQNSIQTRPQVAAFVNFFVVNADVALDEYAILPLDERDVSRTQRLIEEAFRP